jgi:predicted peroxiredoxin
MDSIKCRKDWRPRDAQADTAYEMQQEVSMSKFVFVLTRGMEDPTRVTRTFQLAKAAHETGHEVSLFLTDDAVFLVKDGLVDNVAAPTGDEAGPHLFYLIENKIPIFV